MINDYIGTVLHIVKIFANYYRDFSLFAISGVILQLYVYKFKVTLYLKLHATNLCNRKTRM